MRKPTLALALARYLSGHSASVCFRETASGSTAEVSASLTRQEGDVAARPELLRVRCSLAADGHVEIDPVRRVGRALAVPRVRVEVVVPDVLAAVAGN